MPDYSIGFGSNENASQNLEILMSEHKKGTGNCSGFAPAVHKTVGLGVKLVGATALDTPQLIAKVLSDEKVKKQLAEKLKKVGEELMKQQNGGKQPSLGSSLGEIGSTVASSLKDPAISEVKKSPGYKKLQTSLSQTKCAFENSPVGVFINENKTLLIIVSSVAAIGGGVAMYHSRSGDGLAKYAKHIPEIDIYSVGGVNFSLKKFKFEPSTRTLGADVKASAKWKNVQANFQIGGTFKDKKLDNLSGSGKPILA